MKTSAFASLLLLCAPSAVRGGSKMSKGSKGSKKAKCLVDNSQEAAAFGSKMWGELWYAAVMAEPKCDRTAIAEVWSKYLTEDIVVWVAGSLLGVGSEFPDVPVCCGIDECAMESPSAPGTMMPSCTYFLSEGTTINCNSQNYLSFSAHNAVINEEDCTRLTVSMNEYVTYGDDAAIFRFQTGRTYGWKLTGKKKIAAKLEYIRFNCPFDLKETLVGCLDGFIEDPNYVLEDPTCFNPDPNFPGEDADLCLLD